MRIRTQLVELDDMLNGGLQIGQSYAIKGPAGAGKTVLALHLAKGFIEQSLPVYFISTEVEVEKIETYFSSFNITISEAIKNKMLILEKMSLVPKGVTVTQKEGFDLSGIITRVKAKVNQSNAKLVIFDSISAFLSEFQYENTARAKFMDFIREITGLNTVFVFTTETNGNAYSHLEDFLVDGIIKIRTEMQENQLLKYISVPKLRNAEPKNYENRFLISRDGVIILPLEQLPLSRIIGESLGIKKLDSLLGGGVSPGSIVLIETNGETNYYPLFLTLLLHAVHQNKGVIIHSNVQMCAFRLLDELRRIKVDISDYLSSGNMVFVDKYNRSISSDEAREITDSFSIEDMVSITMELIMAFEGNNQKIILFSDLNDDNNILSDKDFVRSFSLQSYNIKEKQAIFFTFINHKSIDNEMLSKLRSIADIVLRYTNDEYINSIRCYKSSTGATFLPKLVRIRDEFPLIEILE